jgi:Tol biopolymer transport system component
MNKVAFFVQYCEPTLQDYLSQVRTKSGESYGPITDQVLTSKGQSRLYVMNLDGTDLTRVDSTSGLSFGGGIWWSPNSKKITFSVPDKNTYHPRIQIANVDGTNPVQIQQSNEVGLTFLGWLPNSQQIRVVQRQGNTHAEALKSTQILTINAN